MFYFGDVAVSANHSHILGSYRKKRQTTLCSATGSIACCACSQSCGCSAVGIPAVPVQRTTTRGGCTDSYSTCSTEQCLPCSLQNVVSDNAQTAINEFELTPLLGSLLALLLIGFLSIRPPPLSTPLSDPQGIDPFGNSLDAVLGRMLVPDGLVPIAVFPSSLDQNVPTLSVIFSESPSEILRSAKKVL